MSSTRAREWAGRFVLIAAATALSLVAIEIGARIVRGSQGGGKEEAETDRYHEHDPLLGWRKKPGAVVRYARREYRTEVRVNAFGLRDPERAVDPPPGVFRALVLGDSFVEGYTVEQGDTLTARAERALRVAGCAAEVWNGGSAGYSTDQEALFYVSHGARFRPSLVALVLFYNDVLYVDSQHYFGAPKPAFELPATGLRLHRYPVREKPKPEPDRAPDEPEASGSAALEMLRERLWYGAPAAHDALARLGLWNPIPRAQPRTELLVYDRRTIAPIEDAWKKVEGILGFLDAQVRARGARFALVYAPSKMEVQESSWRATKHLYRLDDDTWDRAKVGARVKEIAARLEAPFLDLTPSLRSAETALSSTYFAIDGHWNARGHDVAGRALAEWMRSSGNVAGACGGGLALSASNGEVWTPREGDAIELPGDK